MRVDSAPASRDIRVSGAASTATAFTPLGHSFAGAVPSGVFFCDREIEMSLEDSNFDEAEYLGVLNGVLCATTSPTIRLAMCALVLSHYEAVRETGEYVPMADTPVKIYNDTIVGAVPSVDHEDVRQAHSLLIEGPIDD